jgi:putative flippase GtrA
MNNLASRLKNHRSVIQLFRYGLVGLASNLIGYLVYLCLTHFGTTPKITMSILYVVGATIGFLGNRKLTFAHKGNLLGAGVRYVIAHCFGYLINLTILVLMVDRLGYPHQWVQAAAIFVVAGFLFLVFKFFVFAEVDNADGGRE